MSTSCLNDQWKMVAFWAARLISRRYHPLYPGQILLRVVLATGGAGRVPLRQRWMTGDGMALAYRHGVPLRDIGVRPVSPDRSAGRRHPDDRRLSW
ncbi:hypothetical protein ACLK2C_22190 [Escherichia coli]